MFPAQPTLYSPLPQASSNVIGLLLMKYSSHLPFMPCGYCKTFLYLLIASKRTSFFCPIQGKDNCKRGNEL